MPDKREILKLTVTLEMTESGFLAGVTGGRAETGSALIDAVTQFMGDMVQEAVTSASEAISSGMDAAGVKNRIISIDRNALLQQEEKQKKQEKPEAEDSGSVPVIDED